VTVTREDVAPFLGELSLTGPIEPFFVLADWLLDRGERWGDLIAFECRREIETEPAKRRELEAMRYSSIGEIAFQLCPYASPPIGLAWKRGFIHLVSFADAASTEWLGSELARILGLPMAALCSELVLAGADLGDEHVQAMLRVRSHLLQLPVIDIRHNWFSAPTVAALKEAFPTALLENQRSRDNSGEIAVPMGNSWAGPGSDE